MMAVEIEKDHRMLCERTWTIEVFRKKVAGVTVRHF